MDGEFVRRKSSTWGNSSKPKSSLFSSRGFTPPEQQIPVEIPEEIPEPVFLKSVLNSRSKESPLESEQENVKEQGDVSLKSDALEPTDGGELIAQANTPEKSQQDKSKGVGGWLSKPLQWVWGVVQGDFNEDPSISQTVVRTLITLIPGIDQAGDVQDLTAALYKLAWKQQYDEIGPWFDLFITGIGFVPELGSALKGVIKILKKGEDANVAKIGKLLGGLANNLDDFSAFTDIAAKSVKQKISELITHTTQTASALRLVRLDPTGGKIKQLADKLDNFAQSLEEIRGLVDEKFREIGWEIQRQLDELLGGGKGKLATANGAPLPGKGEPGLMRIEGGTGDRIGGNRRSKENEYGEKKETQRKNEKLKNVIDYNSILIKGEDLIKEGRYAQGVTKIDLMGGSKSKLGGEYVNIDLQATKGIQANVDDLSKIIAPESIDEIIVSNPQAPFLEQVAVVLRKGGKITINGTRKNKYFNKVKGNKIKDLGFEMIGEKMSSLDERFKEIEFFFSDGKTKIPQGTMMTTILIRK